MSQVRVETSVEDDGIGLGDEISLKPNDMLANKHFGLAGMYERANLIGAEVIINSRVKKASQVQVKCELK